MTSLAFAVGWPGLKASAQFTTFEKTWLNGHYHTSDRVSNLKYESVRIDFKTVVFIRANPGKKETIDGSGLHVIFIQKQCTFLEVVSPEKWYVTNIKPWA